MAFDFTKGFNKFVETNNQLNHAVNNLIGKDVFPDAKKIEAPRDFKEYESFSPYSLPEPSQWQSKKSKAKKFSIQGNIIEITSALDLCLKYKSEFIECADYYTNQLKFKFEQCSTDFDSFLYYFEAMYKEGLYPMLKRWYSLFLPLGIFDSDLETFAQVHFSRYNKAYDSYQIVAGIEAKQNAIAAQSGNLVGNSIKMQGGGFGFKGAMKGVAKAEFFNIGMSALGKFVEQQSSMSQEEKANVWAKFNKESFFEEVRSDYVNVFLTLIHVLSEKGLIGDADIDTTKESETIYANLQNPMFPADQFVATCVKLIGKNPFVSSYYDLLESKLGKTEEISAVRNYFDI